MRFNLLLFSLLAFRAWCIPIPIPNTSEDNDASISSRESGFPQAAQTGAIISLSLAGIVGLSIGLTEYITSFINRFNRTQLDLEKSVEEDTFARDMESLDREYQNSGIDVLLDLVEKYSHNKTDTGNVTYEELPENENSGSGEEKDRGGHKGVPLDKEDEIGKSRPQVDDMEESFESNSVPEPVVTGLPLPRLPGFPPLSEPANW
jgi:hypothetical protein